MNLKSKKELAAKTLKVGKDRILFVREYLEDIKDALKKEDIRELFKEGAIRVKEIKGRKTNQNKNTRRSPGNIRKKVNKRKREYVIITRKLRNYLSLIKKKGEINSEEYKDMRKKIRNRFFRSKAHLKDYIGGLRK